MHLSPSERFWSKVDKTDTCWLWTAGKIPDGYGTFYVGRSDEKRLSSLAHRYSYELHHGPIPKGKEIDHLCGVRSCVNPLHLEAVTHRENVLRGNANAAHNARKTHCKKGHELTPDNYYSYGNKRHCRTCARAWSAEQTRRKRGATSSL